MKYPFSLNLYIGFLDFNIRVFFFNFILKFGIVKFFSPYHMVFSPILGFHVIMCFFLLSLFFLFLFLFFFPSAQRMVINRLFLIKKKMENNLVTNF